MRAARVRKVDDDLAGHEIFAGQLGQTGVEQDGDGHESGPPEVTISVQGRIELAMVRVLRQGHASSGDVRDGEAIVGVSDDQ